MNATAERIAQAVDRLGAGPLDAASIATHVRPLFSRVLAAQRDRIYLANHSLGRPLDATEADVQEALAAWYGAPGGAWSAWQQEIAAYRARLAALLGVSRADAVIPKASAGQGLRAVLNTWDRPVQVVATRGEFDSLDIILREYARRGRVRLRLVEPGQDGRFTPEGVRAAIGAGTDLVVLSTVMFQTGQRLGDVEALVGHARGVGARVLLDVYHMLGVMPVDLAASGADFAVGGSYKYLRGGPGACFVYASPSLLDAGLATLDIGWFAKADASDYPRSEPPRYAAGGDAWLEGTPAVLPFYQARAGQIFTLAIGVERLRTWSMRQQRRLVSLLASEGIAACGGDADHGAFVAVHDARAQEWVARLAECGVVTDARGDWLRLCPDLLTTEDALVAAARALGAVARA